MNPFSLSANYVQEDDASDELQELRIEITDLGGGPYVVLETERWAINPEELDQFVATIRALIAQTEAHELHQTPNF